MVALRPSLGNAKGSGVLGDGEVPAYVPPPTPDRRFHHPSYELLRSIVREEIGSAAQLDEDEGIQLLASGLNGLAQRRGRSERTTRRGLQRSGIRVADLIRQIRLRMTREAIERGLLLHVVARWLGFASAVTYRRFIRREAGSSVRSLRGRGRESAAFLQGRD